MAKTNGMGIGFSVVQSKGALDILLRYDYPGNVCELCCWRDELDFRNLMGIGDLPLNVFKRRPC
ncbi:MAG TPA: hypothetical protein PKU94_04875 [Candidatus Hydrothermia bacterium]|nr:hypothetical protein [Candidatus Hydrothermae bacterium]MDD3648728.1 hypothetical protein [Candidatus Hydrothermia bacterium]MDD5573256.1 hypothetical protein [Candidatus Hydrothermia bacterium]HOK22412.1 hypothetical protein [Candidatus Hydrothermia bacterium]HOL23119.1 hypothetical protein [Candidatus Hydrothermia bacterium]